MSLGWWSSSSMNATCYGAISAAMFGVKLMSIEVPIINERSKQTYYGAVNLSTQQCYSSL